MICIAVINEKGGVGKTTTAVNLAFGLARRGQRVLLLDLDPQSNATISCGFDWREFDGRNVGEALITADPDLRSHIVSTEQQNLYLVPATRGLRDLAHELVVQGEPLERLDDALNLMMSDYDYAIMDLPPTLEILQEMAIEAADRFIIPLELAPFAVDGLTALVNHLAERKGGADWTFRILLSRVRGFSRQPNEVSEDDLGPARDYVLDTRIRFNGRIPLSQREGQDIFTHAPHSRGARDFRKLTHEIMTLWPAKTAAAR